VLAQPSRYLLDSCRGQRCALTRARAAPIAAPGRASSVPVRQPAPSPSPCQRGLSARLTRLIPWMLRLPSSAVTSPSAPSEGVSPCPRAPGSTGQSTQSRRCPWARPTWWATVATIAHRRFLARFAESCDYLLGDLFPGSMAARAVRDGLARNGSGFPGSGPILRFSCPVCGAFGHSYTRRRRLRSGPTPRRAPPPGVPRGWFPSFEPLTPRPGRGPERTIPDPQPQGRLEPAPAATPGRISACHLIPCSSADSA
jgi:hypothetical protein